MKLTTLAFATFAAFATAASGASLQVDNILTGGGSDLALLDNAGNGLVADAGAFIAVYVFPGGAPADFAALQANGANGLLASIGLVGGNTPTGGALFTQLDFANAGPPNGPGALDGQNLFLVIGNNTDAATSDQLALISTGIATAGSDVPIPNSLAYSLTGASNVLIGEVGPTTIDWTNANGDAAYNTAGLRLAAIPEPSSSLLFGLAGLALFIRRKR
jgi:hypothetical protein